MEIPSSDVSALEPRASEVSAPSSRADPTAQEAIRFLRGQILPLLRRDRHRSLRTVVQDVVDQQDLRPLGELTERDRRILLSDIEECLAHPRSHATPRSIVRLTSVISGVAAPELRFARWGTAPVR
jgi:hypothetical protein